MNRDTEVLKIQILAGYYRSRFTSISSFIFSFAIAFLISIVTLFFQNVIGIILYTFGIIAFVIWLQVGLFFAFREYHKNLNRIDKLIQDVNKGEPLLTLKELRKKPL